ncbi:MFS transporter [Novosphingobium sp.]|uniref:MFS transporter n=1 Tax=Novosphingobium sp. TaxID=1874826 RepID=UPI0028ADE11B|nr:MFS transporter [Novosphingobium sp.]
MDEAHESRKATTPLSPVGVLTLLSVASLTIMVGYVIVPGLPSIASALNLGKASGWLITLPSLGVVLFGPVAGRIIDAIGPHGSLRLGLLLYGNLGLAAVFLPGVSLVLADRVLLGGATALVMCGGTALISEFFAGKERLRMIARQGMAIELGGVIFLALGGWLTAFGWAAPFSLYAVALLFLAITFWFIPQGHRSAPEQHHCVGTVGSSSLKPVFLAALCSMVVFFAAVILLPFRLTKPELAGLSESQTGYFLSFVSLVAVGFAGILAKITARIGDRRTLMMAFVAYAAAYICFATAKGLAPFVLGGISLGAGFGLSIPLVNHMTVERSPVHLRGRNLAYLSMAIFAGQFLASPLGYVPGGTANSMLVAATIALAAALFGLTQRPANDVAVNEDQGAT